MTSRSRESLKRYFSEGALPTEDHFADLIDSMLNMSDEGFRKSVERGFEVYAPQGHDALISFFRDQEPRSPVWRVGLGSAQDQLLIHGRVSPEQAADAPPPALLCLDRNGRIGVGNETPEAELDVVGTLRSTGRQGAYTRTATKPLKADGNWQDLTDDLTGCQAFEVMAGVGHAGTGRFGLLHATCINTYNPTLGLLDFLNRKRGIRCTHGYYSRRCDRLELRWSGSSGRDAKYRLQIRSGCDFGQEVQIQVNITQLWFDPHMAACKVQR
ncbi:hypothetical protein [Chitinimonas sp.]|uniref:hypothetical protein n=1 Tax=Chitinimonas sp. TaxID=1934313 RepID=UPI002F9458CE